MAKTRKPLDFIKNELRVLACQRESELAGKTDREVLIAPFQEGNR